MMKPLPRFSTAATSEGNRIYKVKRPAKLDASAADVNGWYDGELKVQLPPKKPSGGGAPAGADSGPPDDEDGSGPPIDEENDDF